MRPLFLTCRDDGQICVDYGEGEDTQEWMLIDCGPHGFKIQSARSDHDTPRLISVRKGSLVLDSDTDPLDEQLFLLPKWFYASGCLPNLEFASEAVKGDKELVEALARIDLDVLFFHVSDDIKTDREIMGEAFRISFNERGDHMYLQLAHPHILDDKDLMISILKRDGKALMFMSDSMRSDRDAVIEAVRQNPEAIEFALGAIKEDSESILTEAAESPGYSRF